MSESSTEVELRDYVEHELARFVARDPRGLRSEFRSPLRQAHPSAKGLWWSVELCRFEPSELLLDRYYLLEAYVQQEEFVIWFGAFEGFPRFTVRDVMLPAIHVPFRMLRRDSSGVLVRGPTSEGTSEYSLCEVLMWMHEHQYEPSAPWDSVAYPMSVSRY